MKNILKLGYLGVVLSILFLSSFESETFNCRRLKAPTSLEDIIASRSIKILVLDMDFTLVNSGESIGEDMIEALLNEKGMDICIVTGAFYETVDRRVLSQIRQYNETHQRNFDWTKFYLFTDTGSAGFVFDESGESRRFFNRIFSLEQSVAIEQVVEDFRAQYGQDSIAKTYESQSKFTSYFRDTGLEAMNEYVEFFSQRLSSFEVKISSGGNRESIDITMVDKGEALRVVKTILGLNNEDFMVVGDSFKDEYSNDKSMLLEGALVFNVGEVSSRVGLINTSDYFDSDTCGPQHTLNLLNLFLYPT
ncbi:MAG: hypothetical protein P9X27_00265 [Candidatus Kaelpia aquatica]|nr:hypothetical protein [Candidatus Kaelpia aquatica]